MSGFDSFPRLFQEKSISCPCRLSSSPSLWNVNEGGNKFIGESSKKDYKKTLSWTQFNQHNMSSFFHTKVFCAAVILQLAVCYLLAKINRHKSCLQDVVEIDFDYWTQFHQLFFHFVKKYKHKFLVKCC